MRRNYSGDVVHPSTVDVWKARLHVYAGSFLAGFAGGAVASVVF